MKERKDCKIVQDLLPNYVEHLTNEETNKYINEHIETCEECKSILKNMQKDIKTEGEKRDGREVDYIKKYNKKLKVIKNVQIVVLTLLLAYVVIVIERLVILRNISNKQAELAKNNSNFHLQEIRIDVLGGTAKTDIYSKDGKAIIKTDNSASRTGIGENSIAYQDEDEIIIISDFQGDKSAMIMERREGDNMLGKAQKRDFLDAFLDDLKYAMYRSIGRNKLDGVEVYIWYEEGRQTIIDKKTGRNIKQIANDYSQITTIEWDTVTDKDVARPDLTNCNKVKDFRIED